MRVCVMCAVLKLTLSETWGDVHYLGLTGLEAVGQEGQSIPLDITMLDASPRDLNDLPDHSNDLRTLDKSVFLHLSLVFSSLHTPTSLL